MLFPKKHVHLMCLCVLTCVRALAFLIQTHQVFR